MKYLRKPWRGLVNLVLHDWDAVLLIIGLLVGAASLKLHPAKGSNQVNWAYYAIGILFLLVIAIIKTRSSNREANKAVQNLVDEGASTYEELKKLCENLERPPLLRLEERIVENYMHDTFDLSISGITLGRTIPFNSAAILGVLRKGGDVRVMLTQPLPRLEEEFPKRFHSEGKDKQRTPLKTRLQAANVELDFIAREAVVEGYGGRLIVGKLPFIAPCGIIMVKRDGEVSLRCEIYQRSSPQDQIAFYLNSGMVGYSKTLERLAQTFEDYWRVAQKQDLMLALRASHGTNSASNEGGGSPRSFRHPDNGRAET